MNHKTKAEILVTRKPEKLNQFAFSGIHLLQSKMFGFFPDDQQFSIINFYLELAKTQRILAFDHSETGWYDIGKYHEFGAQCNNSNLQQIIKK